MVEIVVFTLVLVAIFVAKAASIMFMGEDAVEKSASFSWMKPGVAEQAVAWKMESEPARATVPVHVHVRRHPKAA